MSDVVKTFNPDQVAKSVAIVVSTLKWISTIVPGDSDDKVVAQIIKIAEEPWFVAALTFLINKFDGDMSQIKAEDFILAAKIAQGK
jgi:hypothetical protein